MTASLDGQNRIDQNLLSHSINPYLLQHAHNPIWWQEWSQNIVDIAKGLNRPLFISIGYSSCHWCHVMEEESFSDPEVAEIINRYFISIKVDREERPDLDTYYMNAAHFLGVSGGWPLNVFADSNGVPFWICTYSPPEPRHSMTAFKSIVTSLGEAWDKSSEKITSQTIKSSEFMKGFFAGEIKNRDKQKSEDDDLKDDFFMKQQEFIDIHKRFFDDKSGGFKFQAHVKFPNLMSLSHLLELAIHHLHEGKESQTLSMMMESIGALIRGGIYDHLGGGLFRYSTDYEWKVPHFEKMLYDNSLLIDLLADVCRSIREISESSNINMKAEWDKTLTKLYSKTYDTNRVGEQDIDREKNNHPSDLAELWLSELKEVLVKTLRYWNQEMSISVNKARVFFAAQDAGDKESEGSYYVWTLAEIDNILTSEEQSILYQYYDLYPFSKSKETFILGRKKQYSSDCRAIEKKLFTYRTDREAPFKDQKILLSWNAMMACSYLHVYEVFDNEQCRDRALEIVDFLDREMFRDGLLLHSVVAKQNNDGYQIQTSSTLGFLADYAHLCRALLFSYRITGNERYLNRCVAHCQTILKYFYKDGSFSEVNPSHHDTPISTLIEAHDGVEPSSQSLIVDVFLQLDLLYPHGGYYEKAQKIFRQFYESIGQVGLSYMTRCFYHYQKDLSMLSLHGKGATFHSLRKFLGSRYLPSLIFLTLEGNPKNRNNDSETELPSKSNLSGMKAHAVVCRRQKCSQPLYSFEQIAEYLFSEQ